MSLIFIVIKYYFLKLNLIFVLIAELILNLITFKIFKLKIINSDLAVFERNFKIKNFKIIKIFKLLNY